MKIKKLTSILLASLACLSLDILIPSVYSCSSSQSSSNQQQESNNQFNIKTDSGMIGVILYLMMDILV